MPEAIIPPQKRVLGDSVNNSSSILKSPNTLKKRKLDNGPSVQFTPSSQTARRKVGSTQPQKSQFEEEVLEKLTQDIGDLKENNSEKDQQWERPPLGDFDETKENICFQQIDAEEAVLMGKPAIRLFGVTEVNQLVTCRRLALNIFTGWTISLSPRYRISALPLYRRSRQLHQSGLRALQKLSRAETGPEFPRNCVCTAYNAREYLRVPRESEKLLHQDHSHGTKIGRSFAKCFGDWQWKHELQRHVEWCRWNPHI